MVDEKCGGVGERQNQSEGFTEPLKEARFIVYGRPVPKQRPRVANGHAFTPEKTKDHEEKIALVYKSLYHGAAFKKDVPLRVVMDFFYEVPKSATKKRREMMIAGEIRPTGRPDVDNLQKCVADAINGVAYKDDAQIVEMVGNKHYSSVARTEIYITGVAPNG